MQPGKLDRRITIERKTETRDALNNPVPVWSTLIEVWAGKHDISDSERLSAQQVGAEISTRFVIRWSNASAGITPKDRLVHDSTTYDIVGIKETGRRKGLEISARARADA